MNDAPSCYKCARPASRCQCREPYYPAPRSSVPCALQGHTCMGMDMGADVPSPAEELTARREQDYWDELQAATDTGTGLNQLFKDVFSYPESGSAYALLQQNQNELDAAMAKHLREHQDLFAKDVAEALEKPPPKVVVVDENPEGLKALKAMGLSVIPNPLVREGQSYFCQSEDFNRVEGMVKDMQAAMAKHIETDMVYGGPPAVHQEWDAATPACGKTRWNVDTGYTEVFNGEQWLKFEKGPSQIYKMRLREEPTPTVYPTAAHHKLPVMDALQRLAEALDMEHMVEGFELVLPKGRVGSEEVIKDLLHPEEVRSWGCTYAESNDDLLAAATEYRHFGPTPKKIQVAAMSGTITIRIKS